MYEQQRDQLAAQSFNVDQTNFALESVKVGGWGRREGTREGGREEGREGGRERGREGGRKGGKEGGNGGVRRSHHHFLWDSAWQKVGPIMGPRADKRSIGDHLHIRKV